MSSVAPHHVASSTPGSSSRPSATPGRASTLTFGSGPHSGLYEGHKELTGNLSPLNLGTGEMDAFNDALDGIGDEIESSKSSLGGSTLSRAALSVIKDNHYNILGDCGSLRGKFALFDQSCYNTMYHEKVLFFQITREITR